MRLIILILFWAASTSSEASRSCDYFYVEIAGWFMPVPNGYYLRSADVGDFGLYMTFDNLDCHPGNPKAVCKDGGSGFQVSYFDEVLVRGEGRWDKQDDWNDFSKYRAKRSELEDIPFDIVMYIKDGVTFSLISTEDLINNYQLLLEECASEIKR